MGKNNVKKCLQLSHKLLITGELSDDEMLLFDECEKQRGINKVKGEQKVNMYKNMWKRRFIN